MKFAKNIRSWAFPSFVVLSAMFLLLLLLSSCECAGRSENMHFHVCKNNLISTLERCRRRRSIEPSEYASDLHHRGVNPHPAAGLLLRRLTRHATPELADEPIIHQLSKRQIKLIREFESSVVVPPVLGPTTLPQESHSHPGFDYEISKIIDEEVITFFREKLGREIRASDMQTMSLCACRTDNRKECVERMENICVI